MTESEEKAAYSAAYEKGKADGEYLANRRIAIELTNVYFTDGPRGWFSRHRNTRIKAYLDDLWAKYGPSYDDD